MKGTDHPPTLLALMVEDTAPAAEPTRSRRHGAADLVRSSPRHTGVRIQGGTMKSTSMLVAFVATTTLIVGTGCRSHVNMRQHYLKTRTDLVRGDWKAAAEKEKAAKDNIYNEDDRVMFWLNLATAQHNAGDYSASQANFVKAEQTIQDLFTKSVSAEAAKLALSETLGPYEGEDFEKILLYYYTALNKFHQGKINDALVEARRADEFLKKIQVRYQQDDSISTIYRQDAFMLWLVGLFYELEGAYNDAYLAYKQAYRVYQRDYRKLFRTQAPSFLAEDIVRTGKLSGLGDEVVAFGRKRGVSGQTANNVRSMAEVIFVHGVGEAPYKKQFSFTTRTPDNQIIRVALPEFAATTPRVTRSRISIAGQSVETEMAEPITSIALANFNHQKDALKARAIARALIKYAAIAGTKAAITKSDDSDTGRLIGDLVGLFGSATAALAENADLRGWTLLPSAFRVARVWVPAGSHALEVDFLDSTGNQAAQPRTLTVDVRAGERRIINIRTVL